MTVGLAIEGGCRDRRLPGKVLARRGGQAPALTRCPEATSSGTCVTEVLPAAAAALSSQPPRARMGSPQRPAAAEPHMYGKRQSDQGPSSALPSTRWPPTAAEQRTLLPHCILKRTKSGHLGTYV